ncbi:MAG: ketoacyl-ACP synthase III [Thermoleophilia bacterium]|nr:ketoacyl-ACP synthase III [Thermoleophilia bacterium]
MLKSAPGPLLGRPVTITGLGAHVPERVVTNDDLATMLDTSDEWITQRTGIRERRIVSEGVSASDLGIVAARAALADAGIPPDQIGLVITSTISPDRIMPATASRVAYECGCTGAGAMDVSAGCTGFVYALAMAAGAVASGFQDHALVVGAEAISRLLDWEDRSTAVLFGDGAGAVVVSAAETPAAGILGFDLGGDGRGDEFLLIPAGGSRLPASHATVDAREHYMRMNGHEVYKFATRVVADSARRVLKRCGREVGDIDLFVPHQANLRIIDAAVRKLGFSEDKVYTNLQKYGNTSCASIPLCLSEARAEGRLRDGDLVLLMGFGAGLTWGGCLLEWGRAAEVKSEKG